MNAWGLGKRRDRFSGQANYVRSANQVVETLTGPPIEHHRVGQCACNPKGGDNLYPDEYGTGSKDGQLPSIHHTWQGQDKSAEEGMPDPNRIALAIAHGNLEQTFAHGLSLAHSRIQQAKVGQENRPSNEPAVWANPKENG